MHLCNCCCVGNRTTFMEYLEVESSKYDCQIKNIDMRLIYVQRIMLFVFVVCTFFLPNCTKQQRNTLNSKPTAIGTPGQVLIVIDPSLANTSIGDSIMYLLEAPYQLLPSPEPVLDVTLIPFADMTSIKYQWKNIIFIGDLSEDKAIAGFIEKSLGRENTNEAELNPSLNFASQKNRWAKGQNVMYLYGFGKENIAEALHQRATSIIEKVESSYDNMINATTYSMGYEKGLTSKLSENMLIDMKIPGDYRLALDRENHYWFRKQTRKADLGILVQKIPYEVGMQVDEATLLKIRDVFGKKYIVSTPDNSYMITDKKNLTPPVYFKKTAINGNYALEARGVWKMKNGFMGGAFVSYLVYHEPTQSLVFVDGFVYAPEEPKRKYIQRLDAIFQTLNFLGEKPVTTENEVEAAE